MPKLMTLPGIKVERATTKVTGPKRQWAPYTIKWTCPSCASPQKEQYFDAYRYISHPVFGQPTEEDLCCLGCDYTVKAIVTLDLIMTATLAERG